ncbi:MULTISPECIES: hypothetical protein [Nostocales]|uniref:Uncharacterized protein n=2 Tax=Nostocales TaxID=1161 RepID=A0ABW8WSB6_9CYAN|nr:hypothetical protein [Tolypothrix bouteillei]
MMLAESLCEDEQIICVSIATLSSVFAQQGLQFLSAEAVGE